MRTTLVSLMLALPALAATGVLTLNSLVERRGGLLFAIEPPRNSAEAAALGDAAATIRYLTHGEDPLAVHPIRPDAISSTMRRATTAEAMILSRRSQMLILLEDRGVLRDPAVRAALACLAADIGQNEAVGLLFASAPPSCEPGAALQRVLARSAAAAKEHH